MTKVLTNKGINAQRKLFSDQSSYDNEMRDVATAASTRVLYRAVVVDVIYDPHAQLKELMDAYGENLSNASLLTVAPYNSVIARLVSDAADKRNQTPSIFYPMFSHIHQPIKPGERVWVMFEDPDMSRDIGFWVSRVVERSDIDDPNFTHADRAFIDQQSPSTIDRFDLSKSGNPPPGPSFPNGSDTKEGYTLAEPDAFEKIEKDAIANRVSTREPVPRYRKRPGDNVMEGSNNTLIVLGEDRTGATSKVVADRVSGKPDVDKSKGTSGAIDIVVGRGIGVDKKLPPAGAKPKLTAPAVIKNVRGLLETDKDPANANKSEGDVDFENDAARIYIAMDTDIDGNFGKQLPKLNDGVDVAVVDTGAAIIVKSDHTRVISRVDGTIRIIKEGDENDENGTGRAVILMEKDGTTIIDSPKIIIGSGIEKDNGAGTQVYIGRDATEPLVMGDTLKKLLGDYTTAVEKHITTFANALETAGNELASPPNSLGNLGVALPGIKRLSDMLKSASPQLKSDVSDATKQLNDNINSMFSRIGRVR